MNTPRLKSRRRRHGDPARSGINPKVIQIKTSTTNSA
jgi:hypothetical protein